MERIRILALRQSEYPDLSKDLENPLGEPCCIKLGSVFYSDGGIPEGFCPEAWKSLAPFVVSLLNGEEPIPGWMKNKNQALVSCNDGFRPMSFLLERVP